MPGSAHPASGRLPEILQELRIRRDDKGRGRVYHILISLERTHETIKLLAPFVSLGLDFSRLGISLATILLGGFFGLGHYDNRLLVGLRPDFQRLLLPLTAVLVGDPFALGLHTGDNGYLVLLRKIGALDPHIHHFHAVFLS